VSYRVVVRRNAELDIAGAIHWYQERRRGLGSEFHAQFSRTIERLADNPLIYPVVYRGVRRAVLHRFPYLVWYRVQDSVITVLACTHAKRHPAMARARLADQ